MLQKIKLGGLRDDIGEPWIAEQLCTIAFATGILDAVAYPGELALLPPSGRTGYKQTC